MGHEINLGMSCAISRHLKLESGYNCFVTGPFVDQAGRSEDVKSGHVTATYTF